MIRVSSTLSFRALAFHGRNCKGPSGPHLAFAPPDPQFNRDQPVEVLTDIKRATRHRCGSSEPIPDANSQVAGHFRLGQPFTRFALTSLVQREACQGAAQPRAATCGRPTLDWPGAEIAATHNGIEPAAPAAGLLALSVLTLSLLVKRTGVLMRDPHSCRKTLERPGHDLVSLRDPASGGPRYPRDGDFTLRLVTRTRAPTSRNAALDPGPPRAWLPTGRFIRVSALAYPTVSLNDCYLDTSRPPAGSATAA